MLSPDHFLLELLVSRLASGEYNGVRVSAEDRVSSETSNETKGRSNVKRNVSCLISKDSKDSHVRSYLHEKWRGHEHFCLFAMDATFA